MIARQLELDCTRCHGTGRVILKKSPAVLCSCPAGRSVAMHVVLARTDDRRIHG